MCLVPLWVASLLPPPRGGKLSIKNSVERETDHVCVIPRAHKTTYVEKKKREGEEAACVTRCHHCRVKKEGVAGWGREGEWAPHLHDAQCGATFVGHVPWDVLLCSAFYKLRGLYFPMLYPNFRREQTNLQRSYVSVCCYKQNNEQTDRWVIRHPP